MKNVTLNPNTKLLSGWFKDTSFYSPHTLSSASRLKSQGQSNALSLFHSASKYIPAYKDFLKSENIRPDKVSVISDFEKVPLTTKENYIEKYPAASRCWHGRLDSMHMISTSSGTTGQPNFWPRNLKHEIDGAYPHELIFDHLFNTHKKSTLVVNGFAMGNWIAGTFTQACINLVSWKGHRITLTTPGYSLENVLQILSSISNQYDQTVITGHNPFLKEIIDAATVSGLDWSKIHPKFLGTGQAVTESWRKYLLQVTGAEDYYHTFYNLYGSADASLMGFETPLSIYLRQTISESGLQQSVFSDARIPSIFSYDPRLTFIESVSGELCLTKDSGCPLIRYNIHDEGGTLQTETLLTKVAPKLPQKYLNPGSEWRFPLVYLFGRSKFMAKIYGANIYIEHVQQALDHASLQSFLTGRFILDTEFDRRQNPKLVCRVELTPNRSHDKKIIRLVQQTFVDQIRIINQEYDYVFKQMGSRVKPKIILLPHADKHYFPTDQIKKTA